MSKPKVFLSHIHSEAELAQLIRNDLLDAHLLSAVEVFVSSDAAANPAGTSWLNNIEDNLRVASVILILASPASIERPWINVEAGAGWVRYLQDRAAGVEPVAIMPLCHSGLSPGQLPLPWSTFNAVQVRTAGGLQAVLDTCARAAKIRSPRPDLGSLVAAVDQIEMRYTVHRTVEARIRSVLKNLPVDPAVFRSAPPSGAAWVLRGVRQAMLHAAEADLLWLAAQKYISYSQCGLVLSPSGNSVDISVAPCPLLLAIVSELNF